ncbi:MAG: site-2 protease family protein [Anaerolineae bacterium]|nr:site-2 protease family protein [Anaerolineae bacterium]
MLIQFLSGNFSLAMLVAVIIAVLIAMTIHELGHCLMATWWGDPTPRENGRLTLNPFVHIYWPGFLMFVFIGFGILGYAPVNARRMRDPRWGSFWTSAAGPLANLALAIFSALLLRLFFNSQAALMMFQRPDMVSDALQFIALFLGVSVFYNVLLFVFNLIPLFPIDGWRMVLALLPGYFMRREQIPAFIRKNMRPLALFLQQPAFQWERWAQLSQFVLMALILFSLLPGSTFDVLGAIIGQPTAFLMLRLLGF